MKSTELRQSPCIPVDFTRIEAQLEKICRQAEDRLENLLSDERLRLYAEPEKISSTSSSNETHSASPHLSFELRLGATRLSQDELESKKIDEILPLTESEKGLVQICSRGKICGKGVLLIVEGKLAVKIIEIFR